MLTKFEVARVLGLRSLHLSEGAVPLVHVRCPKLRNDTLYVAALELYLRKLDVRIMRAGTQVDVREEAFPPTLVTLLDTKDNGDRQT
jgi:DNA-directed RNA polymerase subunit K/omega